MGMNPLDFLNSFLRRDIYEPGLEEYRRKRKEMFLQSPNESVRLNAQYPIYGPARKEAVEKIAGHWGIRNPTLPDYVRDFPPEVQRVAQTFAPLPPEIPDHIALARSKPSYKKWLASSKNFSLGGKQYRWEEAPVGNIPEKLLSIPQTKSVNYSNLLSDLTSQKRAITGNSRYIPVLVEPFK